MAITVAQAVVNSASFTVTAVASVAKTLTVSAGSYLAVWVTYGSLGSAGLVTISDNQSGTYQGGYFQGNSTDVQGCASFYRTNATTSGSITVTATFSSNQSFVAIWVAEITGSSGIIDGFNHQIQTSPGTGSNALTSGTINNSAQPGLVLGFCFNLNNATTATTGTGFSSDLSDATTTSVIEHLRVTSTGTQAPTFTTTAGTSHYYTSGFVFMEGTPTGVYVKQEAQNNASGSGTSIAVTIQATAGSIIHGWCTGDFTSGITMTPSDSATQSYTIIDTIQDPTVDNIILQQFWAKNSTTGSLTITITYSPATSSRGITIMEIIGATSNGPDVHTGNNQTPSVTTTDGTTSGNVTPSSGGLIVGMCAFLSSTAGDLGTLPGNAGTGFTASTWAFQDIVSDFNAITEHKLVTSPSSLAATYTALTTRGTITWIAFYDGGPSITVQPAQTIVYSGNTATFTVTATSSGGSLSYQWKLNGSNVGTNSSSYTTPTLLNTDNLDIVQVIVTDSNGSVNSQTVYILVIPTAGGFLLK